MRTPHVLFWGLTTAAAGIASISGKVTNTSGAAISGAVVWLERGGQRDTTEADGRFTLQVSTAVAHAPLVRTLPLDRQSLQVGLTKRSAIEIAGYGLGGRLISVQRQTVDAGVYVVTLPHAAAGGVRLYRVSAEGNGTVVRSLSVGGRDGEGASPGRVSTTGHPPARAKIRAAMDDVLAATKSGYLDCRVIASNTDTSGVEVAMIQSAGTVTDIDGNVYQTVKIGPRVWTVENLRVTKYNDGTPIPQVTADADWAGLTTPAFCTYANTTNAESIRKHGALYNWHAVDPANPKKIAPAGWHVPTDAEWEMLRNYLINNGYCWDSSLTENRVAKSLAAMADWPQEPGVGAIGNGLHLNNRSGFTALPAGCRNPSGTYDGMGRQAYWWSSVEEIPSTAWYRSLAFGRDNLVAGDSLKNAAYSVRLVNGDNDGANFKDEAAKRWNPHPVLHKYRYLLSEAPRYDKSIIVNDFENGQAGRSMYDYGWYQGPFSTGVSGTFVTDVKESGKYGMAISKTSGGSKNLSGWASFKFFNFSGCNALRMWIKPDGANCDQNAVMHTGFMDGTNVYANGELWQGKFPDFFQGSTPYIFQVRLADFRYIDVNHARINSIMDFTHQDYAFWCYGYYKFTVDNIMFVHDPALPEFVPARLP